MSVVIIDYGLGNLGSIENMCRYIGVSDIRCSSDPKHISDASHLILPGVGSFDDGIKSLKESNGFESLCDAVFNKKTPVLGICLGMQLLFNKSEEGHENGLGWIPGSVVKFPTSSGGNKLRVPHMGWNVIHPTSRDTLFKHYDEEIRFYFVHSYYVCCDNDDNILATTHYGDISFTCAVQHNNIMGAQFHPEKSHRFGMQLFRNFLGV